VLIEIPSLLTHDEIAAVHRTLDAADWLTQRDLRPQSALAMHNQQLPERRSRAHAGAQVLAALSRSALFFAAPKPLRIYPPLFNRYDAARVRYAHRQCGANSAQYGVSCPHAVGDVVPR
jgi:PKHD-type hydroxylase